MHGLPPDFMVEDFPETAFHAAYLALWTAIEAEDLSPSALISRWTGRQRSTVYAWRESGQMPQAADLWRLVRASSSEGYDQMARAVVSNFFALTQAGEVLVNGTFRDEVSDLAEAAGDLAKIERAGSGECALMIASDLRKIADRVEAEARQGLSPLKKHG